jgi:hypothetical protein
MRHRRFAGYSRLLLRDGDDAGLVQEPDRAALKPQPHRAGGGEGRRRPGLVSAEASKKLS